MDIFKYTSVIFSSEEDNSYTNKNNYKFVSKLRRLL
jgi:hypothetical protein